MPMTSVRLKPGVNTQLTLSQNEAGVSQSQLIRYKDGLIQKIGGWTQYYSQTLASTILDIHAWEGVNSDSYLSVATTGTANSSVSYAGNQGLTVIHSGSLSDITPQKVTVDFAPNFSVGASSNIITIVDGSTLSLTTFDAVFFNTPVAVGGTFLQGAYPVASGGGPGTYTIISSANSSVAVASSGILPIFDTTAGSGVVTVTLPNNNYQDITGLFYGYYAPTTVGGITIQGKYTVRSIIDSTAFDIVNATAATGSTTATMNSSRAEMIYYIALGPPGGGGGWGIGGYGLGGWGIGTAITATGGTPITATDWTQDNWGEVLIACPTGGPIYTWSPDSGFSNASVLNTGPMFNGGIFISMPQQILVAWGSCQSTGVQDPLVVRWSDAGDYTNWVVSNQTSAGSFHIPTGSYIAGGLQAPSYGLIWTDIDAWIMQYIGGDVIFNFTRVGSGCGLIGKHAAGVIAGSVYWCGTNNFFMLGQNGVQVLPCSVWDFIFQNLNTTYQSRIRCAANSTFNEITWYFPSAASTGVNDSYVKFNIQENEWDYGTLSRTAWTDISPLGTPIGTDVATIYQHEMGQNNVSVPINSSFSTGYWALSDGNDLSFVDWILPDMTFGTYSGSQTASCQITFQSLDYPGDTPRSYGPYTFTNATEYINVRIRGRFLNMTVQTNDANSFWRIGRIRFRVAPAGRR